LSQAFRAEFPQQFAEAHRQQEAFMTECDSEIRDVLDLKDLK